MRKLLSIFGLILTTAAWGQWTEPDTTWCPQLGRGAQAPWISNDNLRLYCSSPRDLYVISRTHLDSAWGEWQLLPPHINSTPTQRCPAESPTGDTLYFIGDARTDCENYGIWDVYFTVRTGPCDTCWGPVRNAGPNVSSMWREFSVGISRDGSMLLVSSTRGGYIEPQLYWHDRQGDGSWGQANMYPPEINDLNTMAGHEHPCLSPDNNRLFFWHTHVMMGDIYVSRKVNGVWQQALPLPSPPNNWPPVPSNPASADADPCLATDGRTLWFRQAPYPGDDYHIVVSVDTSNLAVGSREQHSVTAPKPVLAVTTDTSGALSLLVSGAAVSREESVEVYDILGRLVGRYIVQFSTEGSSSRGVLPVLKMASGTYVISIRLSTGTLSATFQSVD